MNEQVPLDRRYIISVNGPSAANGGLVFSFGPKGVMHECGFNNSPKRVPKYVVAVQNGADRLVFDWSGTQDDPGADRDEMEAEASIRMKARAMWIHRVNVLVDEAEQWAADLGWATRRLEKMVEDSWIGKHEVPALLMQRDMCRIMLEPVARSIAGTEGVVDLYLMPAYDDIAIVYHDGDRWNLQFVSTGDRPAEVRDAKVVQLSKQTFEKVLGS